MATPAAQHNTILSNSPYDNSQPDQQPRTRLSSTSSTWSSLTKLPQTEIDILTNIFPALIRWRFWVFYGPFFTGSDFVSSALESAPPSTKRSDDFTLPALRARVTDTASAYAAHKAQVQHADTILAAVSSQLDRVDLAAIHEAYTHESRAWSFRHRYLGWKSSFCLPTYKAIKTIATTLQIPLRQLELALVTYAQYDQARRQSLLSLSTSTGTSTGTSTNSNSTSDSPYSTLTATHLAAIHRWNRLATIVSDDVRDTAMSFVFPHGDRNGEERGGELVVFRQAVQRCYKRFFADVAVEFRGEMRVCGCLGSGVENGDEVVAGGRPVKKFASSMLRRGMKLPFLMLGCTRLARRVGAVAGVGRDICVCRGRVVRHTLVTDVRRVAQRVGDTIALDGLERWEGGRPRTLAVMPASGSKRYMESGALDKLAQMPAIAEGSEV